LVPPAAPIGMQDPPLDTNQDGPSETAPDAQGDSVPFRPEVTQVRSMEAERRVQAFQKQLSQQPWQPHADHLDQSTTPDGMLSVAGVVDPIRAPLNQVLEQLQSQSKDVNTMKGYVTAISNRHVRINDSPLSANPMVHSWRGGLTKTKGFSRVLIPAWDLQIVLKALKGFPFEPLQAASFKFLTWKTVFLLEITLSEKGFGTPCAMLH